MKEITTGTENFKEFIDKNYYYSDKSQFIEVALKDKVSFFTRPRRFGKTLNMSMLYYFLSNKEKGNAYLFDGLKITDNKEIMKLQNQFPVISITLKNMINTTFESQLQDLCDVISNQIYKYYDLLTDKQIHPTLQKSLQALYEKKASQNELKNSLLYLSQGLSLLYQQKVIILIDEYDVPLQVAYKHNFYDEMSNFMSSFFGSALKTNDSLEKCVMTGCLRIAKESIFTGLNNFSVFSIFTQAASDCFGFTQKELDKILEYYSFSDHKGKIKEWYDGYLFGNTEIYNPWSTLYYVKELLVNPQTEPISYWANTSSNHIVFDYIKSSDRIMKEEFEQLVQKKSIIKQLSQNLLIKKWIILIISIASYYLQVI